MNTTENANYTYSATHERQISQASHLESLIYDVIEEEYKRESDLIESDSNMTSKEKLLNHRQTFVFYIGLLLVLAALRK